MERKKKYWTICVILVFILILFAFSPIALPGGVYKPKLLGVPYSLWMSFLITVSLVVLTYIGGRVHPGTDEEEDVS